MHGRLTTEKARILPMLLLLNWAWIISETGLQRWSIEYFNIVGTMCSHQAHTTTWSWLHSCVLNSQCFIQRVGYLGFPTPELKFSPQSLLTSAIYSYYFPTPWATCPISCHLKLKSHVCMEHWFSDLSHTLLPHERDERRVQQLARLVHTLQSASQHLNHFHPIEIGLWADARQKVNLLGNVTHT